MTFLRAFGNGTTSRDFVVAGCDFFDENENGTTGHDYAHDRSWFAPLEGRDGSWLKSQPNMFYVWLVMYSSTHLIHFETQSHKT